MSDTDSFDLFSPKTPNLNAALAAAKSELGQPKKNKTVRVSTRDGGGYSFTYADLDQIDGLLKEVLPKHGLSYTQDLETIASPEGILIGASTTIRHSSGEAWTSGFFRVPSRDTSAQGCGGAATYARRYSLCAAFGIVADADDDANGADGNKATFKPATPAAKPAANPLDAVRQQVSGFDASAAKREAFAAMSGRGIENTKDKAAVMADAESYKQSKSSTWREADWRAFIAAINEGKFDYVLEPENQEPSSEPLV